MELLPAPLMPRSPKHSPFGIARDVLFTATFAPRLEGYTFDRWSIWNIHWARRGQWKGFRSDSLSERPHLGVKYLPHMLPSPGEVCSVSRWVAMTASTGYYVSRCAPFLSTGYGRKEFKAISPPFKRQNPVSLTIVGAPRGLKQSRAGGATCAKYRRARHCTFTTLPSAPP